ncbi:NAD(P)/FAD-dependent oxidoreductase [Nannocystis sp. SCPEA4]|uniref:NAD(P)-binding protein n=1 Tax=Nannocystis sp. SCPEA4 TaxID=2996787 RepID=UPI00226DFFB7|nr:NAD(P)-binding protein [Nannocystis sp. SCPEA4]
MKRRRFLGGAAGTVAAAATCGPGQPDPPAVEFVGPDPERGHHLREWTWREGPVHETIRTDVAIVGAGVAGSAAAWRLRRAGLADVHLFELEDDVGGTARGGELPRSRHPLGAHYLPTPPPGCPALERLLADLGIILGRDAHGRPEYAPSAIAAAPLERHFGRGRWYEGLYPAAGETADEAAQWARWHDHLRQLDGRRGSDGRPLFAIPVSRSSAELRRLDAVSFADYLTDLGLTSDRLRWAVDYACRDDYGCTLAQTSAFAGLHHFLARGLEETRGGFLLTWPEGNARLVRGMLERADLGDRLHRGAAVVAVDPVAGELLVHRPGDGRRLHVHARAILWAAPRFVLTRLLAADPLAPGALTYAPWLVASVEVRTAPRGIGARLAWDNVPLAGPSLGYVVATHGETADVRRPGAVLTYYEPLCGDGPAELAAQRQRLLSADLSRWSDHVVAALSAMHPGIASEISSIAITRWGHAMIRPVPGLLFGPELARARAPIDRVRPCAADVAGLPLFEEAFYQGSSAALAALADLGRADPDALADELA